MSDELLTLGFIEYEHYVPVHGGRLEAAVEFVLDPQNRATVDGIRRAGQQLVQERHTTQDRARLIELISAMGVPVRALLREKGTPYAELGLADPKWSDDQLVYFMLAHPILINRPIVQTPKGTKLCRPSEAVLDLLDNPVVSFVKEDGEVVTRNNRPRGEEPQRGVSNHVAHPSRRAQ